MLRAILNKSWRQHPIKQQQDGHLPLISKSTQARRTRYARLCWRSKDKLISDVLQWTPSHGPAKVAQPVGTYLQQLCTDSECSLKDMPVSMDDRNGWWERAREILARSVAWYIYILNGSVIYIYIYILLRMVCYIYAIYIYIYILHGNLIYIIIIIIIMSCW